MKKIIFVGFLLILPFNLYAANIRIDVRDRPPEIIIKDTEASGPLIDVISEAIVSLGHTPVLHVTAFEQSLLNLKKGSTDIIPRLIRSPERENYAIFMGPISEQIKNVYFLVKKGKENAIKNYDDLKTHIVGVKRETLYFDRFNKDTTIQKVTSLDDSNMALMFKANRFDTMIILDKKAIETQLKKNNITNYAFADYKYEQVIPNYYGCSKSSEKANICNQINSKLIDMRKSGRIKAIYNKYQLDPEKPEM